MQSNYEAQVSKCKSLQNTIDDMETDKQKMLTEKNILESRHKT